MKWKLAVPALFFALLGATACTRGGGVEAAREDRPASVSPPEQEFLVKTAQTDLAEIDMARSALKNSANRDVRDFANMIQTDGVKALGDVTDLMRDKFVREPSGVAVDLKRDIDRMARLTGPEFNREFMNMMVAEVEQSVERFRDQSNAAEDPDVMKFADDSLPQLEMHLEKARRLQSKLFNARR
jgi:putative membrane protein